MVHKATFLTQLKYFYKYLSHNDDENISFTRHIMTLEWTVTLCLQRKLTVTDIWVRKVTFNSPQNEINQRHNGVTLTHTMSCNGHVDCKSCIRVTVLSHLSHIRLTVLLGSFIHGGRGPRKNILNENRVLPVFLSSNLHHI